MPRLENWSLCLYQSSPYEAPELSRTVVAGEIYDDENGRFEDGEKIRTGTVQELDMDEGILKTNRTTYELGSPDKDWIVWLEEQGYKSVNDALKLYKQE